MNGFLNINKPSGMTSFSVIHQIRKQFSLSKIGHLGTLDPLATGVLPIAIGKATKLFDFFLKKEKEYIAKFTFGIETDTLDAEGQVVKTSEILPKKEEIEAVLSKLIGEQDQVPPLYSAKNVNGARAYQLARNGVDFTLPAKKITIYDIKLKEQLDEKSFSFFIHCSSGTYIRSIARDLAVLLNTYAYMSALTRIKSGVFTIENAISLDTALKSNLTDICVPMDAVLTQFETIVLPDSYYDKLKNGVAFAYEQKKEDFLVYCKNEFFGIANSQTGVLKLKLYLKE